MSLSLAVARIGFFGQAGPIWAFLGFVALCIFVAILFKILKLLLPALGVTEPWVIIIFWLGVLACFVVFLNYAFGGWF